jgi:hypothetical protein
MFCKSCGQELPVDTVFCTKCGVNQGTELKKEKSRTVELVLGLLGGIFGIFGALSAIGIGSIGDSLGVAKSSSAVLIGVIMLIVSILAIDGAIGVRINPKEAGNHMLICAGIGLIVTSFFLFLPAGILLIISGILARQE